MNKLDGRKRTAMYFGNASPIGFLEWYNEVKNKLKISNLEVTHLGFGTIHKPSKRITRINRTEKRYIKMFNESPKEAKSWEIFRIDENEEYLSNNYRLFMNLSTTKLKNRIRICAMVSLDISLLKILDFYCLTEITKKYIDWEEEVIFDCGKQDIPFNYGISHNPKVFKKIKILSKRTNDKEKLI